MHAYTLGSGNKLMELCFELTQPLGITSGVMSATKNDYKYNIGDKENENNDH